jgi:hypothetical protein
MEVGDKEGNVVALYKVQLQCSNYSVSFLATKANTIIFLFQAHRYSLPSQDDKALGSHRHESRKLLTQDSFDFIRLFDTD